MTRLQADIKAVPESELKRQFLDTLAIPYRRGSDSSSYSSSIDKFKKEEEEGETPSALKGTSPISRAEMGEGGLPRMPAKTMGKERTREAPRSREAPPSGEVSHSEESLDLPRTPAEAMEHPDVQVYTAVTGPIPGLAQYQAGIEVVRLLRVRQKLDGAALRTYLAPYWLAWSSRKRLDGRPYDPGNTTWLAEWVLNESIPPPGAAKSSGPACPAVPTPEETRRMLAEKDKLIKQATPMPEELRAKIRGLAGQMARKDSS
jgi:hypothetical protein